jgi:hypothetical protein
LKINNKSRINISDRYKIMVNSIEVHLGLKISYPEVGHKNIFSFVYKNDLGRFSLKTK